MNTSELYTKLAANTDVNFVNGYVTKALRQNPKYKLAEVALPDFENNYISNQSKESHNSKLTTVSLNCIADLFMISILKICITFSKNPQLEENLIDRRYEFKEDCQNLINTIKGAKALERPWLISSVAHITIHLAQLTFSLTSFNKNEIKLNVWSLKRDQQELTGQISKLFNKKKGYFLIQEARFHKKCYTFIKRQQRTWYRQTLDFSNPTAKKCTALLIKFKEKATPLY